jgi:hypothetical protein
MLKLTYAVFMCICLAWSAPSVSEVLGNITDYEGKVTLHKEGSPRGKKVKRAPTEIKSGQFIRTYAGSKARVKLVDDSKILVTEKSTLEFEDDQNLSVQNGQVLFSINKREATRSLNIITKTAVIGVKGTAFLVDIDEELEEGILHLQEGEIEVKSLAEEFEDFKAEYEQFKKSYLKEFEDFKKTMSIKSGTTLSLSSKGLKEIATPEHIEALFKELDDF